MTAQKNWSIRWGQGPILAMAVHNGHNLREEVRDLSALDEKDRLREEDPFTGIWTGIAPNRLVVNVSRFEVDLNRPRDQAVY